MVRPYQSKDHNDNKVNDEASEGRKYRQRKYNDVNENSIESQSDGMSGKPRIERPISSIKVDNN